MSIKPVNILLADDDKDDRFFFDKALKALDIPTELITVEDGEQLMDYLLKNLENLPDVLFLDLNMPRKKGDECLSEISLHPKLKELPVIIYSTSLHEEVASLLYNNGAFYYIQKTDLEELQKILNHVLTLIIEKRFTRPSRKDFVLNIVEAHL